MLRNGIVMDKYNYSKPKSKKILVKLGHENRKLIYGNGITEEKKLKRYINLKHCLGVMLGA